MAKVAAINISEIRGIQKHEIPEAFLKEDWGIEGDAHAGNWHRQVSLLSTDSVKTMQDKLDFNLEHGAFAENILVEGMEVHTLPVGTRLKIGEALTEVTQIGKECHRLKIGEALTEVTQIGKECHKGCAIREITGDCVMPREGIFVKVLRSGNVKTGDEISVCEGE